VTDATAASDSRSTTPKPSLQLLHTSENTAHTARTQQIVTWREEGISYYEIARRLNITRQRATQLWEQAQTAKPAECWCGTPIPPDDNPGRPRQYCSPQHRRQFPTHPRPYLSPQKHNKMRQTQNDLCAICTQPETATNRNGETRKLAIDHDHNTGQIRELLCTRCNSTLGWFNDNPERMEAAAAYLQEHLDKAA
jgi:DNA-binding CsgD family transcriptional regulator